MAPNWDQALRVWKEIREGLRLVMVCSILSRAVWSHDASGRICATVLAQKRQSQKIILKRATPFQKGVLCRSVLTTWTERDRKPKIYLMTWQVKVQPSQKFAKACMRLGLKDRPLILVDLLGQIFESSTFRQFQIVANSFQLVQLMLDICFTLVSC